VPSNTCVLFCFFETGSHDGLKLEILLPQLSKSRDYMCAPPCLAIFNFYTCKVPKSRRIYLISISHFVGNKFMCIFKHVSLNLNHCKDCVLSLICIIVLVFIISAVSSLTFFKNPKESIVNESFP
jgi:hypothetical protein